MMMRAMKRFGTWALIFVFYSLALGTEALAEETVCIQCHGGQAGALGAPVEAWRGSVHAENGISCHGCHGGDPTDFAMAMSPERGFVGVPAEAEVPDFCGRCHVGVKEDYLQSKHGQALGEGGPTCVTCHGNHAVARATADLINEEDCSRCHEYGRAEEIKAAVTETDRMIAELDADLAGLHRVGITTGAMEGRLFSLRNEFHRLFHSVDVELVRKQTQGFQDRLGQLRTKVEAIRAELDQRKLWGAGVVVLFLLAGIIAALLRRTYGQEEREG